MDNNNPNDRQAVIFNPKSRMERIVEKITSGFGKEKSGMGRLRIMEISKAVIVRVSLRRYE